MKMEELYSESYLEIWNMVEDAFSTISHLWDEIGDHDKETRIQMKDKYINSIREVLQTHINEVVTIIETVRNNNLIYT